MGFGVEGFAGLGFRVPVLRLGLSGFIERVLYNNDTVPYRDYYYRDLLSHSPEAPIGYSIVQGFGGAGFGFRVFGASGLVSGCRI